jgi:hypothetical protein
MNNSGWVDPRIQRVRVSEIRSYLQAHGWRLQAHPGPRLLVFEGPVDDDGQRIVQVLPSSERLRDYLLRVEELIAALSVLEDRPAADILSDILTAPQKDTPLPSPEPNGARIEAPSANP